MLTASRGYYSKFIERKQIDVEVDKWTKFLQQSSSGLQASRCLHNFYIVDEGAHCVNRAPNDTAYKRWSCHSGFKLLCKLCRTSPPPAMGARFTVFWACRPCGPAGWLALLLTKAGDVETNPGPTTLNKKVWICDICHKQIHVRKQISIRCNRIEHWVHLRCAGIRQAQYTDTWTCHLHRESRLTPHTDITPPHRSRTPCPSPLPTLHLHHPHHRNQNTD